MKSENIEQLRAQHICRDFPQAIGLSIGEWPCTRRCRMCPMHQMQPTKKIMEKSVFERACSIIGDRPVLLDVNSYGETFMEPLAIDYMYRLRKACSKAHITFVTNGECLDEQICHHIIDSGIDQLQCSLVAGSEKSYEWLTGSKEYAKVCQQLERLVELKEKKNAQHLKISTHIMGIKELELEFDAFKKKWKPLVSSVSVRAFGNWGGCVDGMVTPLDNQVLPDERYPCAWLWYATKIQYDGNISKCFVSVLGEKQPVGSIMHQDLEKIWKGELLTAARQAHLNGCYADLEYCAQCTIWSLFPNFWEKNDDVASLKHALWKDPLL